MKDFILLQTIDLGTIANPAESVLTRWAKRVTSVSRGAEVGALRNKLEAYKTTILIIITAPPLLITTATSEGIDALQTELRKLSEHLGQCMTRSTPEPETQSQRRSICGSTRSGITLRRGSRTTTTSNRDSLSVFTGETSGRSSDGAAYAASVYSDRSAQSQLSSRSSQYTYEAMSIIDMYMDSIYAISQSSVGSFHVPSANAAFPDATPSEPPIPILLPSESSEKRRGIYRRLVSQGINNYLRELSITDAWVMVFMRTYRSKEGRGFMETITDIEDLKVCAVLLLLLRGLGGSIPLELLEEASITPAELKAKLIPQVHSRLEPIIGKTCAKTFLLGLRALDALQMLPSMISAAVSR